MSDEWRQAPIHPKPDEPISYEEWCRREAYRDYVGARLMLIGRGEIPGPDPIAQLAELEIIDIATGRGPIDDGRCPDLED